MTTDINQALYAFRKFGDTVLRAAYACCGNYAESEDITQDIFLLLHAKPQSFVDDEHLKAWLLRVTVNECRSLLRYHLRRKTLSLDELITASVDPTDRDLWAVVMDLPPRYRDVIYLFYYEQLSIDGICEATGSNPNTVKSQLKRGREKLKGMLEE